MAALSAKYRAVSRYGQACRTRLVRYATAPCERRQQMSNHESSPAVFCGAEFLDPAEASFLQRLRRDLDSCAHGGLIFANFHAKGRQQRQIDFLVLTEHRLTHVELKVLDPSLPVVGSVNGPWHQLLPDGQRRAIEPNPYRQAHDGTRLAT